MIAALVFPDVRRCLTDLIDGSTHMGQKVRAVWYTSVDMATGGLEGPFPLVQITMRPGAEGFLDRVDPVLLECYAPDNDAVNVLESIKASICGTDISTPNGYLDSIRVRSTPDDAPYNDTLNKAVATFDVVSRPIN